MMSPRDLASDRIPDASERPRAIPRPPLWLLVVMTALGPFTMQIMIPGLPVMARDLGVPYSVAQLSLTLYLVGVAAGQLLYGPLSDRFGRRPVLLAGLAVYLVASFVAWLPTGVAPLLAARVAQAAGACSGMVLGRAIVRDAWPRDEAAGRIGYVVMGMTVAPMVAPMLGAVIDEWFGWRANMLACLLFGLPVAFTVWRRLPETLANPQPLPGLRGMVRAYGSLLPLPGFRWIATVSALSTGLFFAFMAGAPFVVVEGMGRPPRDYATAFVGISVSFAAGAWVAGRWSSRLGIVRMLEIGLWIVTLGSLLMLALTLFLPLSLPGFFLPMSIVAIGNGISMPNAIAAAVSVRPQLAGTASGLVGATQMGFGAVMTVVIGAIETGTGLGTTAGMVACGVGSSLALHFARRHL